MLSLLWTRLARKFGFWLKLLAITSFGHIFLFFLFFFVCGQKSILSIDINRSLLNTGVQIKFVNSETGAVISRNGNYNKGGRAKGSGKKRCKNGVKKEKVKEKLVEKKETKKTKEVYKSKLVSKKDANLSKRSSVEKTLRLTQGERKRLKLREERKLKAQEKKKKLLEQKKIKAQLREKELEQKRLEEKQALEKKLLEKREEEKKLQEKKLLEQKAQEQELAEKKLQDKQLEEQKLQEKKLEDKKIKEREDLQKKAKEKKKLLVKEEAEKIKQEKDRVKEEQESLQENVSLPEKDSQENNGKDSNVQNNSQDDNESQDSCCDNNLKESENINWKELGLNPADFEGKQLICIGRAEAEGEKINYEFVQEFTRHWSPPEGLSMDLYCIVNISFDWAGKVHEVKFIKSSGAFAYDIAVRDAFAKSTFSNSFYGKELNIKLGQ